MSGVLRGGVSEQAPSSSVSAAPDQTPSEPLALVIAMFRLAGKRCGRRCTREAHQGAIADSIGRVFDYAVARREARSELDDCTQVPSDGHGLEQHAVVGAHGGDGKALGVE